jgi:hypothetical protein
MKLFPYRIEMQQSLGEAAYDKNWHLLSSFPFLRKILQFCKAHNGLQVRSIFIWMDVKKYNKCAQPTWNNRNITPQKMHHVMHCFSSWYCWNNFPSRYLNADHYFHVLKEKLASSNAWMLVLNKHFFNRIWLNMTIFMTELYLINYLHGSGQHTLHIST